MPERYKPDPTRAERRQGRRKGVVTTYVYDKEKGKVVRYENSTQHKKKQETLYINTGEWVRGWYEHIDKEPIYIHDKKHLAAECEKRGLLARAIAKPSSQGKGWEHKL